MSYTEIHGVASNGEVAFVGQTGNSWKGAYHVWSNLSEKYKVDIDKLEYLIDTDRIAEFESLILKSLGYMIVVSKVDIPILLKAFKEYDEAYPGSTLIEQGEIIEEVIMKDDNMIGVCWNQSSIEFGLWTVGLEHDDEGEVEYVPYNILRDQGHNYLNVGKQDYKII